jgi:hypothetical protein
MTYIWHRENPALFEREKREVETRFPELHFEIEDDIVYVRGRFAITFEQQILDHYLIELQLPRDHPKSLPVVREVGGRIPRHIDRHIIAADGTACVLLPDERWRLWPPGAPLITFLTGPLHSFLLAQSMVEAGEPWPFGEWAHGLKGVFQYYRDLLKTAELHVIITYLEYITAKKMKRHWPCPCKNGKRLCDCHLGLVIDLRKKILRRDALKSLEALKAAGSSASEITHGKPATPLIT